MNRRKSSTRSGEPETPPPEIGSPTSSKSPMRRDQRWPAHALLRFSTLPYFAFSHAMKRALTVAEYEIGPSPDLVVEAEGQQRRMFRIVPHERIGEAQGVLLIVRIAHVVHVAVVRVLAIAVRIHDINGGILVMQPERRGLHGNIQNHFDPGGVHLVHHLIEPGEIELAVPWFVAVPRQVSHPHDANPGLLHQLNVARPGLRV